MPDLYDTALFGAMLLALVFAFLLLPFALWIFVRPVLSRVRRFQFEQDGTVRGSFELSEAPSEGWYWRALRVLFGDGSKKQ